MAKTFERELGRLCRGFPLHSQVKRIDPILCAKLKWPIGPVAWYVAGYDRRSYVAYGFVTGMGEDRWGYYSVLAVAETRIAGIAPSLEKDFKPEFASRLGLPNQEITSSEMTE